MKLLLAVAVLTVGCGKAPANDPAKTGSGSGSAVAPKVVEAPKAGSGSAAPSKKRTHKHAPATAEQKAEFKKHLKAGWTAQKAKKWAESVPEFEAALVAIPSDPRALTELGWSAMNAGDFKKAREADEQAIAIAVDKKVKAAGLYNLGTVQEKTGDKDGALKSYVASLALRPNKTVMEAVGKLGKDPAVAVTEVCKPDQKPCDCMKQDAFMGKMTSDVAKCTEGPPPAPGFHVWKQEDDDRTHTEFDYLFDDAGRYIADLGLEDEQRRAMQTTTVDRIEVKKLGTHQVLWIETSIDNSSESTGDDDDVTTEILTGHEVTICVVGEAKQPTRCPLVGIPKQRKLESETLGPDDKVAKKSSSTETLLDVALGADGVVTIKLTSGPSDEQIDALVGPHKLW